MPANTGEIKKNPSLIFSEDERNSDMFLSPAEDNLGDVHINTIHVNNDKTNENKIGLFHKSLILLSLLLIISPFSRKYHL